MRKMMALMSAIASLLVCGGACSQMFDQYGGYTGLKGSNTSGFFRTEKINGRYWLVTPENNVFWSMGICVLQYYDTWGGFCPTLNYYPNPHSNKAKYPGAITEWASAMHDRMDRWGFNTNACWGVANIQNKAECIRDLALCSRANNAGCRMATSDFPDVWDPKWESTCDTTARNQLSANKDNPWTIGAFPYNELHWTNPTGFKSLPDAFIALPPEAHGKQYWVNVFLKQKYVDIAQLNTAWGTSYTDWTDLLSITSLPDDAAYPARLNDKIDFMEEIADRFYSIATFYMRKYDPNHLVFTTRWAMWWQGYGDDYARPFNERIWKKAGQYCDVFANNGYVDFASMESAYQHSSRVFQMSGKPFIVTEHSYLANDSYFAYSPWWVATQMDRGDLYRDQVKKLLDMSVADDPNDPGNPAKICMGIHWFQCYDEPALGRPDGEKAQFGVFNAQDEAFLPFVEMAATVNSQIYDYAVHSTQFDVPGPPTAISPKLDGLQQSERASSFERTYFATELSHGTGEYAEDPAAALGGAWRALAASATPGAYMVYGPYAGANSMWPGVQCTVKYRLKVADNSSTQTVASIDVASNSGSKVYASRNIRGTDFTSANEYQDFTITFTTPNPDRPQWEFRVKFFGIADVYVDTIKVSLTPPALHTAGPLSDSNAATVWSSAEQTTAATNEFCTIYLGAALQQVNYIGITPGSATAAGMPVDFMLQYSADNLTWITIPGQTYFDYKPISGINDFTFEPVTCRYIRLRISRAGADADGKYRVVLGGISVGKTSRTSKPTFSWDYDGSAASYTLLISPIASFPEEQTLRIEGLTSTSYTPDAPLAQGTWYWTVKAVNDAGRGGRYLDTVRFTIDNLSEGEFDHVGALKCERLADWRNTSSADNRGDGYAFGFLDNTIKSEGSHSVRVAITVNSLNKSTSKINDGTNDIPFIYAGKALDYSTFENFTFDIYPKRYCDSTSTIVPSSKYVHFRMVDRSGGVVADAPVDPEGTLPIGQWSTVSIRLSGRRFEVVRIEFYVKCGAQKLTWDERVFFNIDNLLQAPLVDTTPPTAPEFSCAPYTGPDLRVRIVSDDPETGIGQYMYAVGTEPFMDDLVGWTESPGADVVVPGIGLSNGEDCYVTAISFNGVNLISDISVSGPIRRVDMCANANDVRKLQEGQWVALEEHSVTAVFPGRFYIEHPTRCAGIGVESVDTVQPGDLLSVYGAVGLQGREVVINGSPWNPRPGEVLSPVAMNNIASGGGGVGLQESPIDDAAAGRSSMGLCNLGTLVRVYGRVTYVDDSGAFFYIDDGSGIADGSGHAGIRVSAGGFSLPDKGAHVRATGVITVTDVAGRCARLLRPRSQSDLVF